MAERSQPYLLPVFRSAHEGFGDARRVARKFSYNRCAGSVDPRWPGELRAGIARAAAAPSPGAGRPIGAVEWETDLGRPLILYAQDNLVKTLRAGIVSTAALAGTATAGPVMHDDGSGVPYAYFGFGGNAASSQKIQRRNRTGTITQDDALVAEKILSLGNAFYGTRIPSGGTTACGVYKVTGDPFAAALPAPTIVGSPSTKINNLVAVRRAPVALKPEGIFGYDSEQDLWTNFAIWMERLPHPDNGKVFWYEGDDLIVALGSGGAARFDGFSVEPDDIIPLEATPDERTPAPIIIAAANTRHWAYLATQPGGRGFVAGGSGSTSPPQVDAGVTQDNGASFTDVSANVSDGNPTTDAVITLDPVTTPIDWLVVGNEEPFYGLYLEIEVAAPSPPSSIELFIWTGVAWTSMGIANIDTTDGFARSGWIIMTADPIATGWVQNALNVGGSKTRYWLRLQPSSAPGTFNVSAIKLLPWLPGFSELSGAAVEHAAGPPHLLATRRGDDGVRVTHDMGTFPQGSTSLAEEIGAMIYGPAGGSGANSERRLVLFGRKNIHQLNMAEEDQPGLYLWNLLGAYGEVELPFDELEGPGRLKEIMVDGLEWKADDKIHVYYDCGDGLPWRYAGRFDTVPARIEVNDAQAISRVRFLVGWTLAVGSQSGAGTPRLTRIDALIEPAPDERVVRVPRRTPAVV
jgi:hypothetical protein